MKDEYVIKIGKLNLGKPIEVGDLGPAQEIPLGSLFGRKKK